MQESCSLSFGCPGKSFCPCPSIKEPSQGIKGLELQYQRLVFPQALLTWRLSPAMSKRVGVPLYTCPHFDERCAVGKLKMFKMAIP